ncbi:uroporphyrinogen decarboxylase family protein [Clostridium sp. HV4-5-A1G]|uniref:uroporphyrinogen decarboxylase family protein n=1 Tax=Clostridium sp. HV4-5-A1G TaxID=2004595 RepID=UPI00123934C2|nr:uroporphyrinogen decarboxylase family protein [Clostridium sp. HV4-5-A1G]KAA8674592.1 uroporphyrinogen-III decarboxylase [Clostridium sp. HV4-5-A1G]
MKSNQELYNERLSRINTAVELGKPDRTPVLFNADAFCANYIGMKMSEYASSTEKSTDAMCKACTTIGEIDGTQVCFFNEYALSKIWLSKFKIPGRELPEGSLWQADEKELMKPEDYDVIISKGYEKFLNKFLIDKMDNLPNKLHNNMKCVPGAMKRLSESGIVPYVGSIFAIPYESFCGGRTMTRFTTDLFKIPDKVQAVMDVAIEYIIKDVKKQIAAIKPLSVWIGGWRTASVFLSSRLWQKFVWPYFKRLTDVIIEEGVVPIFHLDSDWERDLEFFKEFPKGKCIISIDGSTNIYKVKEVLGSRMCIMGDVPPSMFVLSNPDEVYNYSVKLIKDIGPSGYILAQGCCIPPNAKPENVKAMISAATGK